MKTLKKGIYTLTIAAVALAAGCRDGSKPAYMTDSATIGPDRRTLLYDNLYDPKTVKILGDIPIFDSIDYIIVVENKDGEWAYGQLITPASPNLLFLDYLDEYYNRGTK